MYGTVPIHLCRHFCRRMYRLMSVSWVLRPAWHSIGYFGDEFFRAITCTATDFCLVSHNAQRHRQTDRQRTLSYPPTSVHTACTGITSYGTLGHVRATLDFGLFNFSGHFRVRHLTACGFPSRKNILSDSFLAVYCINFMIFVCVTVISTLKLFSASFAPILTPKSGDAIDCTQQYTTS